jgi:MEMO1 family protein
MLLSTFRIVPLIVGDAIAQSVAEVLSILWGGPETLIVVSSDLSHYHSYETLGIWMRRPRQPSSARIG